MPSATGLVRSQFGYLKVKSYDRSSKGSRTHRRRSRGVAERGVAGGAAAERLGAERGIGRVGAEAEGISSPRPVRAQLHVLQHAAATKIEN